MTKVKNIQTHSFLIDLCDFKPQLAAMSAADLDLVTYIENECEDNEEFIELKITPFEDKVLMTYITRFS